MQDGATVRFIACGRDPFFPPWRDVAQLNYFNPATREAMIGVLTTIAQHCDGVRCDMAMLVLNDVFAQTWQQRVDLLWGLPDEEFWPEATRRVPMTYLAEVYWDREYQLQQQGFDFTYDKRLLDRLHHGDAAEARGHLQADPGYSAKLARFLENHDEARSVDASSAIASAPPPRSPSRCRACASSSTASSKARRCARRCSSGAGRTIRIAPTSAISTRACCKAIDKPLFHDGDWSLLDVRGAGDTTQRRLMACAWRKGKDVGDRRRQHHRPRRAGARGHRRAAARATRSS